MNERETATRTFIVPVEAEGERLDVFLAGQCPDLTRNQIHNALKAQRIAVDDELRPKGYRLTAGERVLFTPLPPPTTEAVAQDIPLQIIHEDEDFLVVNKPAGMVVHPAPGHTTGTLVNALLHHCRHLSATGGFLRPGIVHRLDRETTGLLVVALNDRAHHELAGQLQNRRLGRLYFALSWGQWPQTEGILEGAVGRHPRKRQKMAVLTKGGRKATTRYHVEEDFEFVQLCRVILETGRTHQIRVQFAHAGHPLVGDPLYGDDGRARNVRPVERVMAAHMIKSARRQMLHAAELTLVHPSHGHPLSFRADLPEDMTEVLRGLRSLETDK